MAEGDDSDEDIGLGRPNTLDYDSDEKEDDQALNVAASQNELIDLGGSTTSSDYKQKAAANIPKLSGPK